MLTTQETEKKIIDFWNKNKIYEKSKKKNEKGKKFYFMDGPPYANGHIHMGHALNKILKDIAMRTQRLQGKNVFDRPGYDTHGVPIEFQIEKEIGSKSKKDIEAYGAKKFINRCKEYVSQYVKIQSNEFKDLGIWMDWENPYVTFSDDYIESVWHVLKIAYEKNLLYIDKYSVHVCPRCETAVAFNEIEYKKQKDKSVYVKFPLKNKKDSFLVIFTTTPWTLPANLGVMVHPDFNYAEVQIGSESWYIAKELVDKRMEEFKLQYNVRQVVKGKDMKGWEYNHPLDKYLNFKPKKPRQVVLSARYVTIEEGTGLVHCAPGHGKEDYEVGKENGLEIFSPVNIDGTLTQETKKYAGKKAREANDEITEDLKRDGFLVYEQYYEHDYPTCWRCKTPLLMIAMPQWFLRISKVHKKLLDENEKVNWFPQWAKARMKAWLQGISDWPISRQRYWGTPLPIWNCNKCDQRKVIGSLDELKKLSGKKKIGMHKPEIDEIKIKCSCGGTMSRISEVLDVWFDSGVSSWAALGYPSNKKLFEKFWPADLNIEGTDQFRGWWNSQLILSCIAFDRRPFENINVHGLIMDINKRKMSKSEGNATTPNEIISKYGRDYLRYYMTKLSKGDDVSYNEKDFADIKKVITILANVNNFVNQLERGKSAMKVEDKWILSRFNKIAKEVLDNYNKHRFFAAVDILEKFLMEDLSRKYIQMIRDRADEVYDVLNIIRETLIKLFAPIIPFATEAAWQELRKMKIVKKESVHLCEWPKTNEKLINEKLEEEFKVAFEIIEAGLAERDKVKIGLRWPLADATYDAHKAISKEVEEIVAKQLNVKKLIKRTIKEPANIKVVLNTETTPELEAEGFSREIARRVQAERKNRGLEKRDFISLKIYLSESLENFLKDNMDYLKTKTGSKSIKIVDKSQAKVIFTIKEREIGIDF